MKIIAYESQKNTKIDKIDYSYILLFSKHPHISLKRVLFILMQQKGNLYKLERNKLLKEL